MSRSRPARVSSSRAIASASRRMSSRSRVTSPMIRMPRPGPGNGLAPDDLGRQAELLADQADLVLEQRAQRLDQLELEVVGQAADVVVGLDVGGAGAAAGLDDVGVERALDQERRPARRCAAASPTISASAASKTRMNSRPMILRFSSGSLTPASASRNRFGGVDHVQRDAGRGDEVALDLLGLALAQQPVVDEHAGQPVADRPLHERRRDRGVDAAGQPADRPACRRSARGSARSAPRRC